MSNREIRGLDDSGWRKLAGDFGMPALLATPPRDPAELTPPATRLCKEALQKLVALLGPQQIRQDVEDRVRHAPIREIADRIRLRAGDLSKAPDAVLYPQDAAAVAAVLQLCAEMDIAVGRQSANGMVMLDLGAMNAVPSLDTLAGLATVEAGITLDALESHLAAKGMTAGLGHGAETLSCRIARDPRGIHGLTLATPKGLLTAEGDLAPVLAASPGGIIVAASLRTRALPQPAEPRAWLFGDFAAGLAAMRQAAREGLAHRQLQLSDAAQTKFSRALERPRGPRAWLGDWQTRKFGPDAVRLVADFSNSASLKRFDALARRLGALPLGRHAQQPDRMDHLRDALLDRGAALDSAEAQVTWSELPAMAAALRTALDKAMRDHAPRDGARGLVLIGADDVRPEGARLAVTWLFARRLEDDVAQAIAIREAAGPALAPAADPLASSVRDAIRHAIDPKGIVAHPGED